MLIRKICSVAKNRHPFTVHMLQIYAYLSKESTAREQGKTLLSNSAEQAVWASKVICQIIEAKDPEDIQSPSLREKMIGLEIIDDNYFFDPKGRNREIVLEPFSNGVKIDQFIYKGAITPKDIQGQSQEKMVFCPNVLVSRRIFEILRQDRSDCLFYGRNGIGKTTSIAFYNYFNQFNCKFWIEAKYDKKKQRQKQALIQKGLLSEHFQKYWHLTLTGELVKQVLEDPSKLTQYKEGYFRQLVLRQVKRELPPKLIKKLQKLRPLDKIIDQIRRIYLDIYMNQNSMVDDIEILVDEMRKYSLAAEKWRIEMDKIEYQMSLYKDKTTLTKEKKEKIKELWEKKCEIRQHPNYLFIMKYRKAIEEVLKLIKAFNSLARAHKYSSAINIEEVFIASRNNYNGIWYPTLNVLDTHSRRRPRQIHFRKILEEKWGKIDFFQYFWSEATRLKKIDPQKEENRAALKQLAKSSQPLKTYLRFSHVQQFFEKKEKCQLNPSLWKAFEMDSQKSTSEKIKKFLGQGDQQLRGLFVSLIRKVAEEMLKKGSNQLRCKVYQLVYLLGTKIEIQLRLANQYKELFPINIIQNYRQYEQIEIQFTPQQFLDLTANLHLQDFQKYLQSKEFHQLLESSPILREKIINYMIIESILPGTQVSFPIYVPTPDKLPQSIENSYYKRQFLVKDLAKFYKIKFNGCSSLYAMIKLQATFDKCRNYPNQFIITRPRIQIRRNSIKAGFFHKSETETDAQGLKTKDIDFVLSRYDPSLQKFEIYTFEVFKSENSSQLDKKTSLDQILQKFLHVKGLQKCLHEQLKKGIQESFVLEHICIAPGAACKPCETNQEGTDIFGAIAYCSLDEFEIRQPHETLSKLCFEHIQKVIRKQDRTTKQ